MGFQARILEWVIMPSSRGSTWPRYQTHVSHVSCISRWVLYHWATWEAPFYLIMAPKSSDAGDLDMPKRSHNVLQLQRWKAFNWIRKEKQNHILRLLRLRVTNLLTMELWRKKETHASFAVTLLTAKVRSTASDKCFVNMEKVLNLDNKLFWERLHSHNLLQYIVLTVQIYYCWQSLNVNNL